MLPRAVTALASVVVMVMPSTFRIAQEHSSSSSTSSISSSSSSAGGLLPAERLSRTQNFRTAQKSFQKQELAYRAAIAALRAKQAELRSGCRADLRRANRDTRPGILLRCYRGDMSGEREMIRKQQAYAQALPGVTGTVRKTADSKLAALLEAVTAIISGIDGGVYASSDVMLDTRRNLREKYQFPAWEAMATLRADHALTATAQLILDSDAAIEEERSMAGSEERAQWTEIRNCLAAQESALNAFLKIEPTKRTPLGGTLAALRGCTKQIQVLAPYEPPSAAAGSSSSSTP